MFLQACFTYSAHKGEGGVHSPTEYGQSAGGLYPSYWNAYLFTINSYKFWLFKLDILMNLGFENDCWHYFLCPSD